MLRQKLQIGVHPGRAPRLGASKVLFLQRRVVALVVFDALVLVRKDAGYVLLFSQADGWVGNHFDR